jgi:hypothetical protein
VYGPCLASDHATGADLLFDRRTVFSEHGDRTHTDRNIVELSIEPVILD